MPRLAAGDSGEQKSAEKLLIHRLARQLRVKLTKRRFPIQGGGWLEVDGACESPPIVCEAWAHIGPPKSAQKHKVLADAFKLLYASRMTGKPIRMILLFGDREAARHFKGRSWMAQALRDSGIEVHVVDLSAKKRDMLRMAQQRQYR